MRGPVLKVDKEGHILHGLYSWSGGYDLNGDAFSLVSRLGEDIRKQTGLVQGTLGDWWIFDDVRGDPNPIFTWPQLIELALKILNCEATRLFVKGLYLKHIPKYKCKKVKRLRNITCSGAKRVNARAGDYVDFLQGRSIGQHFMEQIMGVELKPVKVKMDKTKFRLYGKDESCVVEGTWLDWVMFACNILADQNTKLVCPELYAPGLLNHNY